MNTTTNEQGTNEQKMWSKFHRALLALSAAKNSTRNSMALSHLEEITLHVAGYAEPDYSDPESGLIATGNWNDITEWKDGNSHTIDGTVGRLARIYEALGIELEWCDEWMACDDCGKLVRQNPDSYNWRASYMMDGSGSVQCIECVRKNPEQYIHYIEGEHSRCNTMLTTEELEEHGYKLASEGYKNGFHPGQTDEPSKIAEGLHSRGITRYIFHLDSVGQFDCGFSVFIHESQLSLLNQSEDEETEEDEDEL